MIVDVLGYYMPVILPYITFIYPSTSASINCVQQSFSIYPCHTRPKTRMRHAVHR